MTEIAPCPFCNHSAYVTGPDSRSGLYVECGQCEATGPTSDFDDLAIIRWNEVSEAVQIQQAFDAEYRTEGT